MGPLLESTVITVQLWGGAHSIFTDLNTSLQRVVRKVTATSFSSNNLRSVSPVYQGLGMQFSLEMSVQQKFEV